MTPEHRLVVRARADADLLRRLRARGKRSIRRGAVLLATSPFAAVAALVLDAHLVIAPLVAYYFAFAFGVGLGLVVVGARRKSLSDRAERMLEQARLPTARVHRQLG